MKAAQAKPGALNRAQAPLERLQVDNILCPVDFSEFSLKALEYAIGLARYFASRLVIQHISQTTPTSLAAIEPGVEAINIETQLRTAREEIRRILVETGMDTSGVTVLLGDGDVSERILQTIADERIDLVVLGTHGHRGFRRALLGSVAEGLIHRSACPVLVICRPQKDLLDPIEGVCLKTILVATDFSTHSDRALAFALKWGSEWDARVVLFHGVQARDSGMHGLVDLFPEYNPRFERQFASAWEKIHHVVPDTAPHWGDVDYEVRHGNPKEEILRVAEEKGADLIITGARGTGGSGVPWGSVSSAVVRDGRFPVLVVRDLPV